MQEVVMATREEEIAALRERVDALIKEFEAMRLSFETMQREELEYNVIEIITSLDSLGSQIRHLAWQVSMIDAPDPGLYPL